MRTPRINLRSLRVRLCLWYVFLSMVSMAALGSFSYVYLLHALASSRQTTMERREARLVHYLEDEPAPHVELGYELGHFMKANSDTDILEVQDMQGRAIYPALGKEAPIMFTEEYSERPQFRIVPLRQHQYRTLQQVVKLHGRPYRLIMAGAVDEHYDILRMVETSYLIFLPLMFVASIAGGFMLSHRALEPVDRITRSAHLISLRDLNHRLPVPHTGDELQRLAETWNDLLERLEEAVQRLTQFTSDISHDLRTAITVMLSTSQLALRRERSSTEYRESLETILSECQSTATLLDDLLAASRSDIAKQKIEWGEVDLSILLAECCGHLQARAEMKRQQLTLTIDSHAEIRGDASLLRRLINILLDNAMKYTDEGGAITAVLRPDGDRVAIEVRDTGIGIPPTELSNIFHRFYRADASRNRDQGGSGLGLAIAKWIAEAHHSAIAVTPNAKQGSTFTVSFDRTAALALHG
ncbi:heavy metal sensor kinase [Granulicella aggregans]|uniref:histidine kinase n=1 Tax=Granulicella aggregans TaxID=474949 RepID=A0A7W8E599_9BACT|nr:ATP-binding protein [Granulicella aggregans]MBB5059416.1 heavy metal sensor kinase [Granulicella aggregans]